MFLQELQIFKVIVLGEEELGQSQYQVMCFIMRFFKSNFISSDAMSKLRQVSCFQILTLIFIYLFLCLFIQIK